MSEHDFYTDMSTIHDGTYMYLTLLRSDMLVKFDRVCQEARESNKRVNASWVARMLGLPPVARLEIARFLDRAGVPRRTARRSSLNIERFVADPVKPQNPAQVPRADGQGISKNHVIYASAIMSERG